MESHHVAKIEEDRNPSSILTSKPTGKRHLGRYRLRWEGDIRMGLKEIGFNTRNWVNSAQNRDY